MSYIDLKNTSDIDYRYAELGFIAVTSTGRKYRCLVTIDPDGVWYLVDGSLVSPNDYPIWFFTAEIEEFVRSYRDKVKKNDN